MNRRSIRLVLIILALEIVVSIVVGLLCFARGNCGSDCIEIGYGVSNVCIWVGVKTLLAFIGANAVIWFLLSINKKKSS